MLIVAMAQRCKSMIGASEVTDCGLQKSLHPRRLLWMCEQVELHAGDWPETRLHRWIGFVQCGMMANRMLDLEGARSMFDDVKRAVAAGGEDTDLIDHLDPDHPFELDIGGEG